MKNWMKIALLALIAIFMFACEEDTKTAIVQVTNVSNLDAQISFFHLGHTPIVITVEANSTNDVLIEDGDAGINVDGGRAIVEYHHTCVGVSIPEITETHVDLSTSVTAQLQINNTWGCMLAKNYSTNMLGEMWITVNNGNFVEIDPWEDLPLFFEPESGSVSYEFVTYNGFTKFSGEVFVPIEEDVITDLDLYPDACGIWVENKSYNDNITAVYISPSYETTWGNNDLDGILTPGTFAAWTCDGNMSWDVIIVSSGEEYTFYDTYLDIDDILVIDYPDFRDNKVNDDSITKADNAAKYEAQNTNPRCEAVIPQNNAIISR